MLVLNWRERTTLKRKELRQSDSKSVCRYGRIEKLAGQRVIQDILS